MTKKDSEKPLKKKKSTSTKLILGAFGVLLSFFGGYVATIVLDILPMPGLVNCYIAEKFSEPTDGLRYGVLISMLEGDDLAWGATRSIFYTLENRKKIFESIPTCRTLKIDFDQLKELPLLIQDAELTGLEWLRNRNADLLIWGEIVREDKSKLKLRFLGREGTSTRREKPYKVQDTVLEAKFTKDFEAQVIAVALSTIDISNKDLGKYVVDGLREQQNKIENIVKHRSQGQFTNEQMSEFKRVLGLAAFTIGVQTGSRTEFNEARGWYTAALEDLVAETQIEKLAQIQRGLGDVYVALSGTERDHDQRDRWWSLAIGAYQAAQRVIDPETEIVRWVELESSIGFVYYLKGRDGQGDAQSRIDNVEKAVAVLTGAQDKLSALSPGFAWANVLNRLGIAYLYLEWIKPESEGLSKAVEAFNDALDVIPRQLPLYFASTEENLANALTEMGIREQKPAKLEQALDRHRSALGGYLNERACNYVESVIKNSARTFEWLRKLGPDQLQLETENEFLGRAKLICPSISVEDGAQAIMQN